MFSLEKLFLFCAIANTNKTTLRCNTFNFRNIMNLCRIKIHACALGRIVQNRYDRLKMNIDFSSFSTSDRETEKNGLCHHVFGKSNYFLFEHIKIRHKNPGSLNYFPGSFRINYFAAYPGFCSILASFKSIASCGIGR